VSHGVHATALVGVSVFLGMAGYHWIAELSWIDSFLNASMLLAGMGPVGELHTNAAKLVAGLFALYSGLGVIAAAALLLLPVFHRLLHYFHWERGQRPS
jgi:hypothetical protein